jgi:hypothetical protein
MSDDDFKQHLCLAYVPFPVYTYSNTARCMYFYVLVQSDAL